MKKWLIATCACALALGATATDVKIATREWVIRQLATSGIRVSTATTTHNTNGTFTVTCPFTSDTLTNCVLLSLTFTEPAIVPATPVLRKALLRSAEISDNKVQITLTQGAWTDSAGNEHTFNFGDGYTFTWPEELPEVPSEDHVCELNENCYCIWYNKVPKYPDDYPEEYRLKTMEDFDNASFADIISWIDTASWEDQTTVAGKTRYWITDIDGSRLNLEQIGKIDLWRNSVSEVENKINERLRECCEAFIKSCECNATNPQHDWQDMMCGSHSWRRCRRYPAHTDGSHQYPGSSYTDTHHSCVCGYGEPKEHGTLVPSGEKTYTYSGSVKTGWTRLFVCPKRCGYKRKVTHRCHHTDCGVCDAGDGCEEACHCEGEHVLTGAKNGKCESCKCPTCKDCSYFREDAQYHTGWTPCSEDSEDDNDDGTARGAHCTCQCGWFSHNSALYDENPSEHDYRPVVGEDPYMQIDDSKNATLRATMHYRKIYRCKRCGQRWSELESHVFPDAPTRYSYVSDSICARLYKCMSRGCGYERKDEDDGVAPYPHVLPATPDLCENFSPTVCRYKYKCANCQSYVNDDTHGHVRNIENECKCANGCGFQFDHAWITSACGEEICSYCEKSRYSQHVPTGWTDNGDGTHTCACKKETEAHGTLVPSGTRTPTYNASGKETGWTQEMECPSDCGFSKTLTHVHHFTNCGTCDAGDDCDTVCTGCGGNHVFGDATADECAKCECTMCADCDAHPDETDMTKHAGWMPCSQDTEDDNDDGTANGAHCQCQCLTFGHNAETAHDYKRSPGMSEYEQITDKNAPAFGQDFHYQILGQCTRCKQWKKRRDAHSWPQTPTEYRYVSDSACAHIYECDKCMKTKRENEHEHSLPAAPEVCLDVSASVCRKKFICNNCKGVIPVDGGHVRGDGCKCANGCGRQLAHEWETDACGNRKCSHCGTKDESQAESHSGWTSISSSEHKCACGEKTEAHGTLVASGTRTPTYNASGKESGWTQEMECPSDCGFSKTLTHVHHFTNCGTCDAGDDCDTVCTGCSGNHVFGDATADECAKCECTMCSDCNAHPGSSDMTKHAGWKPCAEDVEDDNDDGKANGGHCQCQCLTFGHNANTAHNYQLSAGMSEYEPYNDEKHYWVRGKCSRCDQWKKQFQAHDYPNDPTEYKYASATVCRRSYTCTKHGCGHTKHDDTHGHEVGNYVEAYVNISAEICRRLKKCANCQSYVPDDTHGHERDSANECKCANGCGFQFDHNWVTSACGNEECSYCHKLRYSQYTHEGWDGNAGTADGHKCACGRTVIEHSFTMPIVLRREGWIVTYRKTCSVCSYHHDWEDDTNPCKNGHIGLPDACGCECGYYSPTGHIAVVKSLHHWSGVSTNGNPECFCDCGNIHDFKDEDSYARNLFPSTSNTVQCLGICWSCKERDRNDRLVSDEDHQAMTESEARGAARCGCKCGKVRSSLIEKFHYRNSTGIGGLPKCRCYGNDARASGAVAGEYHFLDASECPKVCAVSVGGEMHLSAAKDKAWEPAFVPAEVKDHKKKETGNTCGCACGKYNTGNWSQWHGLADFHVLYAGCKCGCPTNKHFPKAKEGCTRLCDGNCTGLFTDEIWKQNQGALYNPEYHDPSESGCGCKCNYINHASAPDKFHSVPNSTTPCFCAGMHKHKFPTPRHDCTTICASCGNHYQYAVAPSEKYEIGQHQWDGNQCKCKCPAKELRPSGHKFDPESCVCFCGDQTRGHQFVQYSKNQVGSHVCSSCGNTITEYLITYKCRRTKCDAESSASVEEGHAAGCGLDPGEPSPPDNYCALHGLYYSFECPMCSNSGSGGTETGGGTGGTGGIYDI